jgi:hypothetical protein
MRNRFRTALATLIYMAVIYSSPGCNRSDRLATFPVHGKVMYRGKPVTGASVAFLAPGASRVAGGTTDESGEFQLSTFEPNDGAIVGTHEVTVKKYQHEPPPLPQAPASGEIDPAVEARFTVEMARWQKTASFAVPKKYTDRKTSDLRKDVKNGDNVIDIELRD